jgi:hypothetical protein
MEKFSKVPAAEHSSLDMLDAFRAWHTHAPLQFEPHSHSHSHYYSHYYYKYVDKIHES